MAESEKDYRDEKKRHDDKKACADKKKPCDNKTPCDRKLTCGPCAPFYHQPPEKCCSQGMSNLMRWALFQTGFFRCCSNERSGWRHKR